MEENERHAAEERASLLKTQLSSTAYYEEQFRRPDGPSPEQVQREKWIKYGIMLVVVATLVTILDALAGIISSAQHARR